MAEQTQVLSMQMVSCEERLARAETDLRIEREWRNSLQTREVQLKEEITGYKLEIKYLTEDRKRKEQLQKDLVELQRRYQASEQTLEELGMQLSLGKLQIVELKEKALKSADDAVSPGGSSKTNASWTPDKLISKCVGCNKEFSITRRKHHCRNCGQIFCNNCSERVVQLPNANGNSGSGHNKPVRVCDICWVQLTEV